MAQLSVEEYAAALRAVGKPRGKQTRFLRAHAQSPGRASTMTKLAEAAAYKSYRPVILLYGKLAARIAEVRGDRPCIWLLMDGAAPHTVSNAHWVLVMHPNFAAALKQQGWI